MIIDSIDQAYQYYGLHPLFQRAFDHIMAFNAEAAETGTTEVFGNHLKAIYIKSPGISTATSLLHFESHQEYIDIQVALGGPETFGWKARSTCLAPKGVYESSNDTALFSDVPDTYFTLQPYQFVIFFPGDVHAPMIAEGDVSKLVMKVRAEITDL